MCPYMAYDPRIHHRRSVRLAHYDYALPGAYYVTLCASHKACTFGEAVNGQMRENACGGIVREEWFASAWKRPGMELDAFIIMPNHLHGIAWILGPRGEHAVLKSGFVQSLREIPARPPHPAGAVPPRRPRSIASWLAGLKSRITSRLRKLWNKPQASVWQGGYYEHIIRDEEDLNRIREYILTNPARWDSDRYNPARLTPSPPSDDEFDW